MLEALIWLGAPTLVGIGVAVGRLSVAAEHRIIRTRLERQKWRLFLWQREIESTEGRCIHCDAR